MNGIPPLSRLILLAGSVALGSLAASPRAQAVTETDSAQFSTNPNANFTPTYSAPANDLLYGLTPTTITPNAGEFARENGGGVPVLTDGAFGTINATPPAGTAGTHPSLATAGVNSASNGGALLVYTLSQPSSINSIVTLGGWNDSGRSVQKYTVSYLLAGSSTFTTLASVNYDAGNGNGAQIATQVILDGFGTISNVTAIQFDFGSYANSPRNGYQGYAELAVTAVPEPSAWAMVLGGGGMLALALRRRACRV